MKVIASRIVIASDIGLNNNLFGAKLLEWIDSYGSLFTYKYLHHTFVTYKMEKTYFLKPAKEGDCLDFYVSNIKFSPISVNFDLSAKNNKGIEIVNTNMTFIAIDIESERPCRLNPMLFELDEFECFMFQNINKFLSKDESIYHNIKHVEEMLNQLKMFKTFLSDKEYKQLYIAICYHDAVHIADNMNNEEKSCEMFKKDLGKVLSDDDINKIVSLIMNTKTGIDISEIKKVKHADLIHDLDLISFIDYETMRSNDVKIRSEFSHFIPLEFYQYKLKFLKQLIKKDIFITEYYSKFNNIAIKNIKKYMKEIKELIKGVK